MAFVSGHGLPLIGFVTLPNSAAYECSPRRVPADIPCMTVVVAGQSRTARTHHSAAVNVGNLRRRISAVRQDESAK